jgi:hypothetical protein
VLCAEIDRYEPTYTRTEDLVTRPFTVWAARDASAQLGDDAPDTAVPRV